MEFDPRDAFADLANVPFFQMLDQKSCLRKVFNPLGLQAHNAGARGNRQAMGRRPGRGPLHGLGVLLSGAVAFHLPMMSSRKVRTNSRVGYQVSAPV